MKFNIWLEVTCLSDRMCRFCSIIFSRFFFMFKWAITLVQDGYFTPSQWHVCLTCLLLDMNVANMLENGTLQSPAYLLLGPGECYYSLSWVKPYVYVEVMFLTCLQLNIKLGKHVVQCSDVSIPSMKIRLYYTGCWARTWTSVW